jgi:hypothetical protein
MKTTFRTNVNPKNQWELDHAFPFRLDVSTDEGKMVASVMICEQSPRSKVVSVVRKLRDVINNIEG